MCDGQHCVARTHRCVGKQGFSLRSIKFLVMDEADRMLSMDFEEPLDKILQVGTLAWLACRLWL
jgi:superfamily II DNA/RNA helicase